MSQRWIEQMGESFEDLVYGPRRRPATEAAGNLEDRSKNEAVGGIMYEYQALNTDAGYFRLLELLPGTRQDDIACRLTDCVLDEQHGTYEALSYVWGDTKELTPIQVNSRTLMIGENLRAALLNVRKADQPRTIWADAVCINQGAVRERNHQVSLMDEIYRNASRTIVWLGVGVPQQVAAAYKMLEDLATVAISRRNSGLDSDKAQEPAFLDDLTLSLLDGKVLESPLFNKYRDDLSIMQLAGAEWWLRAWTIQEILLASQAVVAMGRYAMDWDRCCMAIDYGLAIGIWNPVNLGLIVNPVVVPYVSMHALKARLRSTKQPFSTNAASSTAVLAQSLLEMLVHCRFRRAIDPRDKIYSLLGLTTSTQHDVAGANILGITPDYTLTVSDVYCHATRQLILRSGNLHVLGGCLAGTNLAIPSWVPDWTMTGPAPRPLMQDALGNRRTTHAGMTKTAADSLPFQFSENGRGLVLSGYEVTTVTDVAPVLHRLLLEIPIIEIKVGDTFRSRLAALPQALSGLHVLFSLLARIVPHLGVFADWEAFARKAKPSNHQPLPPAPSDESDPLAIYWQTLSAGSLSPQGRAETAKLFYAWRANLKLVSKLHQWQIDRMSRPLAFVGYISSTWRRYAEFARFLEMAYERRLGCGANGFLALLPASTETGDRIVLVKGGRLPLVVRPGKSMGVFTFVGEAYVHGIMDGESFNESDCAEMCVY